MRRSVSVALVSLFFSVIPVTAFAQTMTPTSSHQQIQNLKTDYRQTVQKARTDFKTKLSQIKDARKQSIVEKVDNRIQEINTNRTTQMTEALTRLSTILDHVSGKTTTTTPQSTLNLITTAKTKITASQTAVDTQKNKDYVIQITTDANLRQAVQTTLQTFSADLKATHQTVTDARQAVIDAIKAVEPAKTTTTPTPSESDNL